MALYRFEDKTPQVDPTAFVAESALVIGDVIIGPETYIGHGAILRGDYGTIAIGECTAIEEGVLIHSRPSDRTQIGAHVTVGHGALIHNATIRDQAVIGMRSVISDYSEVGEWAIIAEGSLVKANQQIPDYSIAVGVPAKVKSRVTDRHQAVWEYGKQLYREMVKRYKVPGAFERID
ncbi:MAG: gamma carbonic anhydrase family protein [Candidatus Alcyoniella australis]|nr:gamma carbonic anhydrase family protein [Candidatus Alcyoniella australis]